MDIFDVTLREDKVFLINLSRGQNYNFSLTSAHFLLFAFGFCILHLHDWANFDSFDADPSQKDDNATKKESNSNGEDLFSKTPFDFVDTLEGDTVE